MRSIWVDSQDLATILDPVWVIFLDLRILGLTHYLNCSLERTDVFVETAQMFAVETGKMSAVETRQLSQQKTSVLSREQASKPGLRRPRQRPTKSKDEKAWIAEAATAADKKFTWCLG